MVNKYGRTNHYDEPAKMCLNGQFFNWYFMDYIMKLYTALQRDEKAKPLLSYMHFNTAHEMTGTRIVNLDANLAKFFVDMAGFPNTLTMIFSDHGHKMTPFSFTEQGRRELFDPAFFMIVPDGVKEKLGPQRMAALETNQKRLFTLQDVHKALMSLHDPEKMNFQDVSQTGIFSVIPASRTCADLYMLPLTRCKCEGFDEEGHIKDNAENHKWLAEFAVGFMNDVTQKQYMKGMMLNGWLPTVRIYFKRFTLNVIFFELQSFKFLGCNIRGEIDFQKLQNFCVAKALMSLYMLCKILSFQNRAAQKAFNTSVSNFLEPVITLCPFNNVFVALPEALWLIIS